MIKYDKNTCLRLMLINKILWYYIAKLQKVIQTTKQSGILHTDE